MRPATFVIRIPTSKRGPGGYVCLVGCLMALVSACGNGGSGTTTPGSSPAPAPQTVPVGANPQNSALDPATHTLYVVNSPEASDGSVSVINAATCNAHAKAGCRRASPTVPVGDSPVGIAVDSATNTIYVTNSIDDTVSVIDGVVCNAEVTSGCNRTPPAVAVGSQPGDVELDPATDTVYVANWGNGAGTTVSVIDGATCNARVTTGCDRKPASVRVGRGSAGLTVDQATDTVYAATVAPSGAEAVAVIDAAVCNARITSGCGRTPRVVKVGRGSINYDVAFGIDATAGTLYVTNWTDNTLSMIDERTCNASVTSGCAPITKVVHVGAGPDGIALDTSTHTMYVSNATADDLTVFNAATCNATVTSGCGTPSRSLRTGHAPRWVTIDPATDTVYVPNGDDDTVSVINGSG